MTTITSTTRNLLSCDTRRDDTPGCDGAAKVDVVVREHKVGITLDATHGLLSPDTARLVARDLLAAAGRTESIITDGIEA